MNQSDIREMNKEFLKAVNALAKAHGVEHYVVATTTTVDEELGPDVPPRVSGYAVSGDITFCAILTGELEGYLRAHRVRESLDQAHEDHISDVNKGIFVSRNNKD